METRDESAGPSQSAPAAPKPKRTRLSCACVRCRKKKIRCDEATPKCTPCVVAGVDCIVTAPSEHSIVAPVRQKTGLNTSKLKKRQSAPSNSVTDSDMLVHVQQAQQESSELQRQFELPPFIPSSALPALPSTANKVTFAATSPQQPALSSTANRVTFAATSPQHSASPATTVRGMPHTPDTDIVSNGGASVLGNPDGLLHDVDPVRRKFVGASSSQIFLKVMDSLSSGVPLTPYLRHAVSSSDEFTYEGDDVLLNTPLPPPEELQTYLDRYHQTSHLMFPVVDEQATRAMAADSALLAQDPVNRVVLYLVICIGNDVGYTPQQNFSQDGSRYLDIAWHGLPLVMSRPFRSSVQALLLFCIALRNRNKDGNAYLHCGTAVRMAQSLGMHLSYAHQASDLDARIFWSCYCLEKLLAFETGRPSALNDVDCSAPLPSLSNESLLHRPGYPALNPVLALIGICQELSLISARLFSKMSTTLRPVEALQWVGECDARLQRWADSLPHDLQPGIDGAPDNGVLPFAARLACPYYMALITLHRLSLFGESTLVTPHLNDPALKPYVTRLRASGSICAQAARATLTTFERLANRFPADKMWTVHAVTSAIFVLALRIWKNPTSMSSRADLQFIQSSTDFAVAKYRAFGYNESFIKLLPALLSKVRFKLENPTLPSRQASRQSSPQPASIGPYTSAHASANERNTSVPPPVATAPSMDDIFRMSLPSSSASLFAQAPDLHNGQHTEAGLSIGDMLSSTTSALQQHFHHNPRSTVSASDSDNGISGAFGSGTTSASASANAHASGELGLWPFLLGDGDGLSSHFDSFVSMFGNETGFVGTPLAHAHASHDQQQ